MSEPIIIITGPTASGKSAFALEIAQKYNGELICADSRTVYKGMDIGTAKPSAKDQKIVRHHLLDVVEPGQSFTAVQFKNLAQQAVNGIIARGRLPIVVGGTGLYIDSLIFDYEFGEPADPTRRLELQAMSIEQLQCLCLENGYSLPENTKNKRHLVRVVELGGIKTQRLRLRPNTLVVAIATKPDIILGRITKRAQQMVADGVLNEVKSLGETYGWETEAMTGNIYRILRPVAEGDVSLEEGLKHFITSDMQLVKRQITWMKRNPYIVWGDPQQLSIVIEHFVQQIKLNESIPDPL